MSAAGLAWQVVGGIQDLDRPQFSIAFWAAAFHGYTHHARISRDCLGESPLITLACAGTHDSCPASRARFDRIASSTWRFSRDDYRLQQLDGCTGGAGLDQVDRFNFMSPIASEGSSSFYDSETATNRFNLNFIECEKFSSYDTRGAGQDPCTVVMSKPREGWIESHGKTKSIDVQLDIVTALPPAKCP